MFLPLKIHILERLLEKLNAVVWSSESLLERHLPQHLPSRDCFPEQLSCSVCLNRSLRSYHKCVLSVVLCITRLPGHCGDFPMLQMFMQRLIFPSVTFKTRMVLLGILRAFRIYSSWADVSLLALPHTAMLRKSSDCSKAPLLS